MEPAPRVVGRLDGIWVYPVKSLAGTSLPAADVETGGLSGDRVWTVVGDDGELVRAKDEPAMAMVTATGNPDQDAVALTVALGRPVHLEAGVHQPGTAPVHLVSRQAVDRAAAGEVPEGCSADDPRANLLLSLPQDDERTWVGRQIAIGQVVLEVTRTPKHCLGVYAEVRRGGVVNVGDPVLLERGAIAPAPDVVPG
jgi:uncharacterized protein